MAYTAPVTNMDALAPGGANIGFAAFTGAGASAPTVAATTVLDAKVNLAQRGTPTIARTGVGDHTYTLAIAASPTKVYVVVPVSEGTSNLDATISGSPAITNDALVVRVLTKTAAGVATDMAAGVDFLKLVIFGTSNSG